MDVECTACSGTGVWGEDACIPCGGDGKWVLTDQNIAAINPAQFRYVSSLIFNSLLTAVSDMEDKIDDVMDKCNDIKDVVDEL